MTPNIPNASLPVLGPVPNGQMGGVPWKNGVLRALVLKGLRAAASFDAAPGSPLLVVTDSDNDLDGPGDWEADPTGQSQTSLRDPHGVSCDSRMFPGVVISPLLKRYGVRLGDFCLVAWQGNYCSAQVYDTGPTSKAGENSLYVNRFLGIVPKNKTDHWAALNGHSDEDVCTLFFPGSGPGHAVPPAEIVARTHALWAQFTGRAAGNLAAPSTGSGAASGSVGLAAPLVLSALTLVATLVSRAVASSPIPPEFAGWLACLSTLGTLVLIGLHLRKEMQPDPPLHEVFATQEQMRKVDEDAVKRSEQHDRDVARIERAANDKHNENVAKLDDLKKTLEISRTADHQERVKLREDVRHDTKDAVSPLRNDIVLAKQDGETQFRTIAQDIGGLKADAKNSAVALGELRRNIDILLSRTQPQARRGGADE